MISARASTYTAAGGGGALAARRSASVTVRSVRRYGYGAGEWYTMNSVSARTVTSATSRALVRRRDGIVGKGASECGDGEKVVKGGVVQRRTEWRRLVDTTGAG